MRLSTVEEWFKANPWPSSDASGHFTMPSCIRGAHKVYSGKSESSWLVQSLTSAQSLGHLLARIEQSVVRLYPVFCSCIDCEIGGLQNNMSTSSVLVTHRPDGVDCRKCGAVSNHAKTDLSGLCYQCCTEGR
jgi:hypothetical protein